MNASKVDAKGDLKYLPMLEFQAQLGFPSEGLNQAEAQKRLAEYGPNKIDDEQ